MKLEVGKTYVLNNGEKHVCKAGVAGPFAMGVFWYNDDGRCGYQNADHPRSVSHEYTQTEGKTLAELDVKAGDVVECVEWLGTTHKAGDIVTIGDRRMSMGAGLWRIVSRAPTHPTIWRDMTDAEKGALLLAKHEGKAIEYLSSAGKWADWVIEFNDDFAYRIYPTPKVETVTVCDDGIALGSGVSLTHGHRITFTTADGKPDTASIRMDEL